MTLLLSSAFFVIGVSNYTFAQSKVSRFRQSLCERRTRTRSACHLDLAFIVQRHPSPGADASAGSLAPYSISGIVENATGQAVAINVLLIYHTPSLSFGNQSSSLGPSGFSFSVAGGRKR